MYCHATLERDPAQYDYFRPEQPRVRGNPIHEYSDELFDLIDGCLRFDPARRFTFAQLKDMIDHFTDESQATYNLSRNMRSGTASQEEQETFKLEHRSDRYRKGLVCPDQLPDLPADAMVR